MAEQIHKYGNLVDYIFACQKARGESLTTEEGTYDFKSVSFLSELFNESAL